MKELLASVKQKVKDDATGLVVHAVAIMAIVGLLIFSVLSGYTPNKNYLGDVVATLLEGDKNAEKHSTTYNKVQEQKAAFEKALKIQPPWGVDRGVVFRTQKMLKEGSEYLATTTTELSLLKDLGIGFLAGVADAAGGGGVGMSSALAWKTNEVSNNQAEYKEFKTARDDLWRYIADNKLR
jgi:hypothetical protein